jgi:hypothetical protein
MKTEIKQINELFKSVYGNLRLDGTQREFESSEGYEVLYEYQFALMKHIMPGSHFTDSDITGYETRRGTYYTEDYPMDKTNILKIEKKTIWREIYNNGTKSGWKGHKGIVQDLIPNNVRLNP